MISGDRQNNIFRRPDYMDYTDFEGETRNRLRRLEQKVDFLLNELGLAEKEEAGLPSVHPAMAEVVALLKQNRKIEAIKVYRQVMNVGLKEAKDAVERLNY
jgi:ribosomal protein L7/L12